MKMLTPQEAESLADRIASLSCTDSKAGDGLFTFVMLGEPEEKRDAYERHMAQCEFCRTALQIYRYKRDAVKLLKKWETAKEIVSNAASDSRILKRELGNGIKAYFRGGQDYRRGTTVLVGSSGEFLSVEEQRLDDFQCLKSG